MSQGLHTDLTRSLDFFILSFKSCQIEVGPKPNTASHTASVHTLTPSHAVGAVHVVHWQCIMRCERPYVREQHKMMLSLVCECHGICSPLTEGGMRYD